MPPEQYKSSVRQQIDENLKRVYDDALKEEVPDKFLELIAKLKADKDPENDK